MSAAPRPPLVAVTWDDAVAFNDDHEDKLGDRAYRVVTVGWLVSIDERAIRVACERLPGTDGWRGVTRIPRSIVLSVQELRGPQNLVGPFNRTILRGKSAGKRDRHRSDCA